MNQENDPGINSSRELIPKCVAYLTAFQEKITAYWFGTTRGRINDGSIFIDSGGIHVHMSQTVPSKLFLAL